MPGCGEGSPASSRASVTSQVKACKLTPFGTGFSSVPPGDPPVRAGHSGIRRAKQEGGEGGCSLSQWRQTCSLPEAGCRGEGGEHAGQPLSDKAASSTLASLSSSPNTSSLPKHKHAISS